MIDRQADAARFDAILAERARRLAARPEAIDAVETHRVCLFEAGGDLFGIAVDTIARVTPAARIAPLANAAPALLGLTSRGGRFALVYDLAALIGAEAGARTDEGHFVLLRQMRPLTMLKVARADAITDIAVMSAEETANLPLRASVAAYGRAHDGRIVSIIDIAALINVRARDNARG